MNDLDKKIAELKGWRHVSAGSEIKIRGVIANVGEGWVESVAGMETYRSAFNCDWAGSDAKALELVDELAVDQEDGFGCRFQLLRWNANIFKKKPAGWEARFEPYQTDKEYTLTRINHLFTGTGSTRPEAICRAYIAAITWLKENKG